MRNARLRPISPLCPCANPPAARVRSGSWTSPSSRPCQAGPGVWLAAGLLRQVRAGLARVSPRDPAAAIAAIELALTEPARLAGRPLHELAERDADGNVLPLVASAQPYEGSNPSPATAPRPASTGRG